MIIEAPDVAPQPRRRIRAGAVLALAGAVAFVAWLVVHHLDTGSPAAAPSTPAPEALAVGPTAVSIAGLAATAAASGGTIYWAGPISGTTLELKRTANGNTYVRYLPAGAPVGDPTPHLEIATYPLASAFADTTAAAGRPGAVKLDVGADAVAFYDARLPTNVYEAVKGSSYQVEVFSPSPQQAQAIVKGGKLVPVP